MVRRAILAFLFSIAAPVVAAQGVLYDCDLTQLKRGGGWISEKIGIVIDEEGRASVSDAHVLQRTSAPIDGTVVRNNDRRLVVAWTISGARDRSGQTATRFRYEATIKNDGQITVYARPSGYSNRFFGTGTCTTRAR